MAQRSKSKVPRNFEWERDKKERLRRYVGYTPEEHQLIVHRMLAERGQGKVVVVKAKRQVGKSMMIENELLRYSINFPKSVNICLSPTLSQSRKVFHDIVNAVSTTGVLLSSNASLLEMSFINGSQILFKSAEQGENLRGYTVSGIMCVDEAGCIPDAVFFSVLPWTDANKANILIVSTPRARSGWFYEWYTRGLEGDEGIVSVDWNDYDLSMFLSPERLEQYRKIYPKNQFLTEYLGEFADGDGMVFDGIRNALGDPSSTWRNLYFGIDWGSGKGEDYTAVTAFNENGEMVVLDYFNDLGTFPQVERIAAILERYRASVRRISAEDNSIGHPMIDLLSSTLRERGLNDMANLIVPFSTTNQSKAVIVSQLQVGLERGEVKLLNNNTLINQLGAYEATYNIKTGSVSYNGAAGIHDDLVISTMLSYDALLKSNKIGTYKVR